jgi:hypothetical protein
MRGALISVAALTACAAQETPAPPQAAAPQTAEEATQADACGASRYAHLIGASAEQIDRAALPPRTRVEPNTMVTMDFSAERLNIIVGADGRVGSMRCF